VIILALGGCVGVPADPVANSARQQLDALEKTDAAARAAPQLAAAEAAVQAAEHPDGDAERAAHLAFIAQKRVEIAQLTAQTSRDNEAYHHDVAQRDAIRHQVDSITTLSTDALGYTPPSLKPIPINANSTPMKDFPPSGQSAPAEPPPAPPEPTVLVEATPPPLPEGALLILDHSAFSGAALNSQGRERVIGTLRDLARWSHTPVVLRYAGAARDKAMSVKTALIAVGVPGDRLSIEQGDAAGGIVAIDFVR
jgi:hypothetical protein